MKSFVRAAVIPAFTMLVTSGAAWADSAAEAAIQSVMHGMFDKPEAELVIFPVVVEGGFAVADWTQGPMGGRAFLKESDGKWTLVLCTGDEIRSAEALAASGVPGDTAKTLAAALASAESALDADRLKQLASFQGMVRMDGQ